MTTNGSLHAAKRAKNDEFYTLFPEIEKEILAYTTHDPDTFRGKTILLPADDPEWSNFTKFFAMAFGPLGIKKVISTSYNPGGKGKKFVLDRDVTGDGKVTLADLQVEDLDGDGDFRSPEVTALRDEADIIITNPPFSLFREFLAWALPKKVLLIGNMNAITYKEVWPHIQGDRLWIGATTTGQDMVFSVPKGTVVKDSDREKAARLGYVSDADTTYTRMGNACWFTNLDHGRRHEPMNLAPMRHTRHVLRGNTFQSYDNYDAIEVPELRSIPEDYDGVMGVPITFLYRYCPEQFEIVRFRYGDDGKDLAVNGKTPYFRILIHYRKPATNSAA